METVGHATYAAVQVVGRGPHRLHVVLA
jgi:hypothetical protein